MVAPQAREVSEMREKRERSAIGVERKHIEDTSWMAFPPHRIGFGGIGFWFSF